MAVELAASGVAMIQQADQAVLSGFSCMEVVLGPQPSAWSIWGGMRPLTVSCVIPWHEKA